MPVKDLLAWFGLTGSVSSRAEGLLRAVAIEPWQLSSHASLGTDRYLTSARRRAIVARLERLQVQTPKRGWLETLRP